MTTAILLMAYGSPASLDEVEPYYTDIRGGRPPSPEALEDLRGRYMRIGGSSPLSEITNRQAAALESLLNARGGDFRAYTGMKHWRPSVADAVGKIAGDGAGQVIGLALAPHFSAMSIGGYESRLMGAKEKLGAAFDVKMVRSWYQNPAFVSFSAATLRKTMEGWDLEDPSTRVFFTAHSLPARILAEGDPYAEQLADSSRLVAAAAGVGHWEFAFQSASHTHEPWLGPDVLDALRDFAQEGGRRALVMPIGFVADHLEILFDVDVECAELAPRLGLELRRTPSPNDQPRFIEVLASVVERA